MSRRAKIFLPLLALALALAAGGAYWFYFHDKGLPGQSISGVSIAGKNQSEVAALIRKHAQNASLEVTGQGVKSRSFTGKELGASVSAEESAKKVFAHRSFWAYFLIPVSGSTEDLVVDYAYPALIEAAAGLTKDYKEAVEPELVVAAGTLTIQEGKEGRGIAPTKLSEGFTKVLREGNSQKINLSAGVVKPLNTASDLQTYLASAKKFAQVAIKVAAADKTFEAAETDKLGWVTSPSKLGKAPKRATADAAKVQKWLRSKEKEAAKVPQDGCRNVTEDGKVTQVVKKKVDGTKANNVPALSQQIAAALSTTKPFSGSFDMVSAPAKWQDKVIAPGAEKLPYQASKGEKWFDINLTDYTIAAYQGADKVIGPYLMVPGSPQHPTPQGTYKVYIKRPIQTMVGYNDDGSLAYRAPNVPWILYWHYSYAIHGAYWQHQFGPGVGFGGSHGCVQLPPEKAKEMFDFGELDTVVRVHK